MPGCLDGVRVLELARYQAGPRCGLTLADLGAEVIKIERPGGEETRRFAPVYNGQSLYFTTYNRGKKSVEIDLRDPRGRAQFLELVVVADVVLENFRPGALERLDLGYEVLTEHRPDVILARVSAFGQTGAWRDRPGFDPLGQALSGLMSITGQDEGRPIGTAFSVVDRTAALYATIGILGAVRHRDRTGEGQVIDVSLMDAAMTMTEIPVSYYLATGDAGAEGARPTLVAKDGHVVISAFSKDMTARLLRVVGVPPEQDDGSMLPRDTAADARWDVVFRWCAARTTSEVCDALLAADVPAAPVLSVAEAARLPYVTERECLVEVDDAVAGPIFVPGPSVRFSKTPCVVGGVPTVGQHNAELLGGVSS